MENIKNQQNNEYEYHVVWVKTVIDGLKIPDIRSYSTEAEAVKKKTQLEKRGIIATIEKKKIK